MIKWIYILLALIVTSCNHDPAINAQLTFTKQYASKMNQSKNWLLYGYGGGFHEGFNNLSFDFIARDRLDLHGARRLIVENVEYLSQLIDSDPQLVPHLLVVPFDKKMITLGVMFLYEKSENYVESPFIALVLCSEGKVGYARFNEQKDTLDIIHRESYEEALLIVNQEQNYQ